MWGAGGLALGLCAMMFKNSVTKPEVERKRLVKHGPLYLGIDPACEEEIVRLQGYEHYAKDYFETIVDLTDQMMLFVKTSNDPNIPWDQSYQQRAVDCYLKVEETMEEFIKCARYWLHDNPVEGYNSLHEGDADYAKQERELANRIETGLKDFKDIVSLKDSIVARLKWHLLNLGVREAEPSLGEVVQAQYSSAYHTPVDYSSDQADYQSANNYYPQ